MYRIFLHVSGSTACDYYRSVLPARHCKAELAKEGIDLVATGTLDRNEHYDAYLFHRVASSDFLATLIDLKSDKKLIIWDFDDNLFKVPEWNPSYKVFESGEGRRNMALAIRQADVVTTSTQTLASQLALANKGTVLPNLIDVAEYGEGKGISWSSSPDEVRILWAGSITHEKDIDIVVPGVRQICQEFKSKVRFIFFGDMVPALARLDPNQVLYFGQTSLKHYPAVLRFLRPDIGIAPLVPLDFNEAKSNIRYLEMSIVGAAVIASRVGPYRETIGDDQAPGVLIEDYRGWAEAIRKLVIDHDRRHEMASGGIKYTLNQYSWQSERKKLWLNFFRSLPNRQASGLMP